LSGIATVPRRRSRQFGPRPGPGGAGRRQRHGALQSASETFACSGKVFFRPSTTCPLQDKGRAAMAGGAAR